jgi:hypothetical protein
MQTNLTLLPVLSALTSLGGAADIEVMDSQINFVKNGCAWQVYAIGPGATYPFILHKDGHRILGFTNPESLTNFFKGVQPG